MIQITCDICGGVIFQAQYGEMDAALRKESGSRDAIRIKFRSKCGTRTNYDDVCDGCVDGLLSFIESRKVISK